MSTPVASLLVDVSNSRTKFVLLEATGSFSPVRILPTAEVDADSVRRLLDGWLFNRATVASVVPQASACLPVALGCPIHMLGAASKLNLKLEYERSETLGSDRLACAMALVQTAELPAIAVDAGTAVTFDVVVQGSQGPVYKGGAIAPGLRTMAHSLSTRTALLPEVAPCSEPPTIGRSTRECLQSGLLHGFAGMVDGVLDSLAATLSQAPQVVFTGGDAGLASSKTGFVHSVDNMLVFKGLAIADALNH